MKTKKCLHALFSGTVQGIGFRYTAERLARQFSVAGYVKNLPDGRVELVAEGDGAEIEAFFKAVRESSLSHYIREVKAEWQETAGRYKMFEIAY